MSVPKRSKRLTITLRRDEGDGSLGFALADNNQVDIPEPNPWNNEEMKISPTLIS